MPNSCYKESVNAVSKKNTQLEYPGIHRWKDVKIKLYIDRRVKSDKTYERTFSNRIRFAININ